MVVGLQPYQIIEKEKLTPKQFNSYYKHLKKQAAKRFKQLDEADLALASELYLQRMLNLYNSIAIQIAQACTKEDEDNIIESHLFEISRNILNDMEKHNEQRIGTAMGMRMANELKERASEKTKDIKVTSDNNSHSHTGVS